MAGVLDYKRFLNTLKTTSDVGNIFPSDQKTWRFEVESTGTADGWTATIQWMTLVIDEMSFDKDGTPNFTNSEPIGYYQGSSSTQYSTGVVSIPKNMYTGKILPASTKNVPLTVVNIRWTKNGENKGQNLAFIQNWEPGVLIGNPYIDSTPIIDETSTLTLENPGRQIYTDIWPLAATSDIPYNINTRTCYFFYDDPAGRVLLGTAPFIGKTATLNFDSDGSGLDDGIYEIYAEFGGVKEYGIIRSNTINLLVVPGIPLLVQTQTLTPVQTYYYPGDAPVYALQLYPDPGFVNEGVAINNDVTITITDENVVEPLIADRLIADESLNNGFIQKTVSITNDMVDSNVVYGETNYQFVSGVTSGSIYTATLIVYNQHEIKTVWDFYKPGKYRNGTTNRFFNAATVTNKTVVADDFPITLTRNLSDTLFTAPIEFTIQLNNTRQFFRPITLYAQPSIGGSASALTTFTWNSASPQQRFTATITTLGTGTWSIYASYPGDIGDSIFWANKPSTSNVLSNQIVRDSETLNYRFFFRRDDSNDILTLWANSPVQLIRDVTFFENGISLGTSAFTGTTTAVFGTIPIEYKTMFPGEFNTGDRVYPSYKTNPSPWPNSVSTFMPSTNVPVPGSFWARNYNTQTSRFQMLTGNYVAGHDGDLNYFYWTTSTEIQYVTTSVSFVSERINRGGQFIDENGIPYTLDQFENAYLGEDMNIIAFIDPRCPVDGWLYYDEIPELTDDPMLPEGIELSLPPRTVSPGFAPYTAKLTLTKFLNQKYVSGYRTNLSTSGNSQSIQNKDTFFVYDGKPPQPYSREPNPDIEYALNPKTGAPVFLLHFYEFTPPVRQVRQADISKADTAPFIFRRNYWETYGRQVQPRYPADVNNQQAADYYWQYGRKLWVTQAINNTRADFTTNYLYSFENSFAMWIEETYRTFGRIPTLTYYQSTQTGVVYGDQIAQITLPLGTITDADTMQATWPGTADLGYQYGKYRSVDTSLNFPDTIVTVTNVLLPTTISSYDTTSTGSSKDLVIGNGVQRPMWYLNQYKLSVDVITEYAAYLSPSALEGTVTFSNADTGAVIGSTSTVNGSAKLLVTATNLTSVIGSNNINVKSTFQSNPGPTVYIDSATTVINVINNFPVTSIGGTYVHIPLEYNTTLWEKDQFFIPETAEFPIPQVGPFEFASFNKIDFGYTSTASVKISGNLDFVTPQLAWGGNYFTTTSSGNIAVYTPIPEGRTSLNDVWDIGFYYRVDNAGPYYPLNGVQPFDPDTTQLSDGQWTYLNRVRSYVNSTSYPGPLFNLNSPFLNPAVKTTSLNGSSTNQTWAGSWTNIKFYFRVLGYFSNVWGTPFGQIGPNNQKSFVTNVPRNAYIAYKPLNVILT